MSKGKRSTEASRAALAEFEGDYVEVPADVPSVAVELDAGGVGTGSGTEHESAFYDATAVADATAAAKPARARPVVPEWEVTVSRLVVETATTKVRAYTSIEATHIALNIRPPRSWKRGKELIDHGYPRAQCVTHGTGTVQLELVEPAQKVEGDLFASGDAAVGGRVLESHTTTTEGE